MKRVFKIIFINAIVLFGLLLIVNYSCLILTKLGFPKKIVDNTVPAYHYIDNDSSLAYNKQIWKELKANRTEYAPYIIWKQPSFRGKTTTINQYGDRIHPFPNEEVFQAKNNLRFFGGSAMWGVGANDNGTIPAIYQNELDKNTLIINHAEKGYTTRQNLAKLINLINTSADIQDVVFYDGFNDILNYCVNQEAVNSNSQVPKINQAFQKRRQKENEFALAQGLIYQLFLGHTLAFFQKKNKKKSKKGGVERLKKCLDEACADSMVNSIVYNWQIAHDLVTAQGGHFYAILQPCAFVGQPNIDERIVLNNKAHFEKIYHSIHQKIAERLKDKNWFVDFSNVLDVELSVYYDTVHISSKGNRIVAKAIYEFLEQKKEEQNEL